MSHPCWNGQGVQRAAPGSNEPSFGSEQVATIISAKILATVGAPTDGPRCLELQWSLYQI
jgi:hypothetical protein